MTPDDDARHRRDRIRRQPSAGSARRSRAGRRLAPARRHAARPRTRPSTWRAVDLLDRDGRRRARSTSVAPSRIYHLAGAPQVDTSWQNVVPHLRANALGTHHLLEAVRTVGTPVPRARRVVGADLPDDDEPISEDAPLAAGQSVRAVEARAGSARAARRPAKTASTSCIARPFNHVGPGQSPAFAMPSFARQIARIEAGLAPPGDPRRQPRHASRPHRRPRRRPGLRQPDGTGAAGPAVQHLLRPRVADRRPARRAAAARADVGARSKWTRRGCGRTTCRSSRATRRAFASSSAGCRESASSRRCGTRSTTGAPKCLPVSDDRNSTTARPHPRRRRRVAPPLADVVAGGAHRGRRRPLQRRSSCRASRRACSAPAISTRLMRSGIVIYPLAVLALLICFPRQRRNRGGRMGRARRGRRHGHARRRPRQDDGRCRGTGRNRSAGLRRSSCSAGSPDPGSRPGRRGIRRRFGGSSWRRASPHSSRALSKPRRSG